MWFGSHSCRCGGGGGFLQPWEERERKKGRKEGVEGVWFLMVQVVMGILRKEDRRIQVTIGWGETERKKEGKLSVVVYLILHLDGFYSHFHWDTYQVSLSLSGP